jgi:hypothetical protein
VEERWREIEARLEPPLLIFALLTIPAIALEYGAQGAIEIFTPRFLPAARDVSSPPKAYATPQCSR